MLVRPLAFLLAWTTVSAQDRGSLAPQEPPPDNIIRINVNLVQIDAVVTGSQGQPLTRLMEGGSMKLGTGPAPDGVRRRAAVRRDPRSRRDSTTSNPSPIKNRAYSG